MTKRIFQSIVIVAGAVLLASFMIILGCLYEYFTTLQEKQLTDELSLAATAVEENGVDYLSELHSQNYRLTWIDATGEIIYDTQADEESMENHSDREEIQEALAYGKGESSRFSATLLEKTIYQATRLTDGTVLRISASRATAGVLVLGMVQPALIVLAIALILSLILAKRVAKRVVAPLNTLDLEDPLENDTYEELAPLMHRIYEQRRQIGDQLLRLQQKNDEFNQITFSMKEGLVLLDKNGVILSINPAAQRLFHTDIACLEQNFLTIERSHDVSLAIDKAFANGFAQVRLERDEREYQIDISRIESNHAVIGAVLLAFDTTAQTYAERNRREFTANVSHELKTPLQSIMGSAELMENGLVKPEDMPRFVGHIRREAARLVTLIEDVIRLSQLDEGSELPYEDVDLYETATEVVSSLQDAAKEKEVQIMLQGEKTVLRSVPRLVTEIVFNLCDNAVKYNQPGGSVTVTVENKEGEAVLTVKDTGIGIPLEHQDRVFERFYRVDKSHSRESGGTGLGLSIVKHAVQHLGGRITLESCPNQGTTIQVTLPKGK